MECPKSTASGFWDSGIPWEVLEKAGSVEENAEVPRDSMAAPASYSFSTNSVLTTAPHGGHYSVRITWRNKGGAS